MLMVVLRFLMPYVGRYVANYIADYLENRRAARSELPKPEQRPVECSPCPPAAPISNRANTVWYSLSGLLLGSALASMLYIIWRDINSVPEFEL